MLYFVFRSKESTNGKICANRFSAIDNMRNYIKSVAIPDGRKQKLTDKVDKFATGEINEIFMDEFSLIMIGD